MNMRDVDEEQKDRALSSEVSKEIVVTTWAFCIALCLVALYQISWYAY